MAISAPVRHMSVEEFLQLEKPVGDFDYELHHGELVQVTRPKKLHVGMQGWLVRLLNRELDETGFISTEIPFRAVPEGDLRAADVALVTWQRWDSQTEDDLLGAPELVIEILSPSNTASEMYEREQLCLENGCIQFWTVDLKKRLIRVATKTEPARFYGPDQEIPLAAFGGSSLKLSEVFSKLIRP